MRFENKVVIITGGNSGIGKAAAIAFGKEGAQVVIADLGSAIEPTITESNADRFSYLKVDVSKWEEVKNLVLRTIQEKGRLDIVVNNAGIGGPRLRTDEYTDEAFDQVMNVNVKGVWYGMKASLGYFKDRKGGCIINIASLAGHIVMGGYLAYAASKHAVLGMTKVAAIEFARYGVRINAVCPGFTLTPMFEEVEGHDKLKDNLQHAIPMRRFGQPEEIARTILFLASDESSFTTGQGLIVDGGLALQ
jgi:NAD(P)-dependent dehydrogenase (short-subunit alcohol dehydrogenase family)